MTKNIFKLKKDDVSDPKIRAQVGIICGIVGTVLNILLFVIKFFCGSFTGIISITADSFNNLSDAGASVLSFVGFKLSSLPPDKKHPFGYGRVEYICSFIISLLIFFVGFSLLRSSYEDIINPTPDNFDFWVVLLLLLSIVIKLFIFLFNKRINKAMNSPALKAVALDSVCDVIVTGSVIIGMVVSYFTGLYLDGYVGLLISLFVIYGGFSTLKETYNLLIGKAPDPDFVKKIKNKVLSYDDVVGIHDLIIHSYGHSVSIISFHAELPHTMEPLYMHSVVDSIENDLKRELNCNVVIHMDPVVVDDEEVTAVRDKVDKLVSVIDDELSIHDFRLIKNLKNTKVIFEVEAPFKFRLSDDELKEKITQAVLTIDETYITNIEIERGYS